MRLIQPRETASGPDDLTARAFSALDRRLSADVAATVCVAVSGGGDSVALLALACDWGQSRGRSVLALSVDHGLQPDSVAWSRHAAETALSLGARAEVLTWTGAKPTSGLPAAARQARHALLANAARAAGASVILMAHTADDLAEAAVMRAGGSTVGDVREWSPSPVWPEGRGLFLLRPLLGERRVALRELLRDRGLAWIEDPANADPKYARSRARAVLAQDHAACPKPARSRIEASGPNFEGAPNGAWIGGSSPPLPGMTNLVESTYELGGGLAISRRALQTAAPEVARRFLSAALLCASGQTRPPRSAQLEALLTRLRTAQPVAATLAGARVTTDPDEIRLTREMPRGGLPPLGIAAHGVSVWDGRFEIEAGDKPLNIVPARGIMARLSGPDCKEILGFSPEARPSVPVISPSAGTDGPVRPVLASHAARVSPLARSRLRAACGLITHERDIDVGRVAPTDRASYVGMERPLAAAGL